MTHTPSTRVEELIRSWAPELRRGFIEVLVARDPPPRLRSRRANTLVALATWTGAALLLVALIGVLRSHGPGAVFVTPNGSGFNVTGTKTADIAAVLGLLFLCVRSPLLAWRIGYALLLLLPLVSIDNAIRPPLAIAILVCYWVAGLRHGRAAAWAMCLLNLLPVWVLMRGQERPLLTTLALFVIQIALDATIASRRAGHALAEQVAQSELDEARRTVLEERTRIAREMHDVVAHHMSLIAVQAETAPYRLDDLSEGDERGVRRAERNGARGAERRPAAARRPPQRRPRRTSASAAAR